MGGGSVSRRPRPCQCAMEIHQPAIFVIEDRTAVAFSGLQLDSDIGMLIDRDDKRLALVLRLIVKGVGLGSHPDPVAYDMSLLPCDGGADGLDLDPFHHDRG